MAEVQQLGGTSFPSNRLPTSARRCSAIVSLASCDSRSRKHALALALTAIESSPPVDARSLWLTSPYDPPSSQVGVRVPLLIRAPWLGAAAAGRRTNTLAELVDIYPTMVDLAGIAPPPKGDALPLAGTSLAWVLRAAGRSELADASAGNGKGAVLSVFARCPLETDKTTWITNVTEMWKNNWCEFVDRSAIPWMGFSMRTSEWRYTEWAQWNGSKLAPNWAVNAGVELYDHRGVDASGVNNDFDATENESVAKANPSVVAQLAKQLHALVAAQASTWYSS